MLLVFIVVALAFFFLGKFKEQFAHLSLRKTLLYVGFFSFGVFFVFQDDMLHALANRAYGVEESRLTPPSTSTRLLARAGDAQAQRVLDNWETNASDKQIAADARVGGVVPIGTATSKITLTIAFYLLSYILTWLVQGITHPAPTNWVKKNYKGHFLLLSDEEKFALIGRLSLNQSIRFGLSVLAASLIQ